MGYTNKTTHYELPQYVATDKPKYLTDFNETMAAIDTQMYANEQAAATADSKAVAAKEVADGAVLSIGTLDAQINGNPEDPSDNGLAGQVTGIDTDLDTVQSLIGSGQPTTSNQTIIGAINGLEAAVAPREDGADLANSYATGEQFARGGSVYIALTSLTAGTAFASLVLDTDYKVSKTLVEQIKEAGEGGTAAGTSYNNAESGLTADDVQEAIDEVVSKLAPHYTVSYDNVVTVTADGVKTVSGLLDDLHAELAAELAALDAGLKIEITRFTSDAISGIALASPLPLLKFAQGATLTGVNLGQVGSNGTNKMITCDVRCMASGSTAIRLEIQSDSTIVWADKTSDVPTSGKVMSLYYDIIK